MDPIDTILEDYERDIEKARQGECKKISRCTEFRDSFKRNYQEHYKEKLAELTGKLTARGHRAGFRESPPSDMHYGFSFYLVPRHLFSSPVDRFYPSHIQSTISFTANEHTLSIDIETVINPNVEKVDNTMMEKIPREQFNEELLVRKIGEFMQKVFTETIILDFRQLSGGKTDQTE